jgi:peptide/nickel transport system permease protein
MIKQLMKKPLFWVGFLYIFLWLAGSFLYLWIWHNHMPIADLKYGPDNKLLAKPPFTPGDYPPLGTDDFGQSIFLVLLKGAKFTLGFAMIISLLRVFISGLLGVWMRLCLPKLGQAILTPFESLSYFPIALLTYFILRFTEFQNAVYHDGHFTTSIWERAWFFVLVLTIVAIPTTTQTVFNESNIVMNKEFIDSAKVLGARRWHLFWRHLRPFLSPKFVLIFVRENIQVLLLMSHLGVFQIAIGGILEKKSFFSGMFGPSYPFSLSNDWPGLIGIWWHFIWAGKYAYIPFIPIVAVTLAILATKAILVSLQDVFENEGYVKKKKKNRMEIKNNSTSRSKEICFEPLTQTIDTAG